MPKSLLRQLPREARAGRVSEFGWPFVGFGKTGFYKLRRAARPRSLAHMIDAIKKAVLAGVGAAAITTEKAEKALNELVDKGKLSATEAKDAARKIADEGKLEFEAATKDLESRIDGMLGKLGKRNRERIDALETKCAALEVRLLRLEQGQSTEAGED